MDDLENADGWEEGREGRGKQVCQDREAMSSFGHHIGFGERPLGANHACQSKLHPSGTYGNFHTGNNDKWDIREALHHQLGSWMRYTRTVQRALDKARTPRQLAHSSVFRIPR